VTRHVLKKKRRIGDVAARAHLSADDRLFCLAGNVTRWKSTVSHGNCSVAGPGPLTHSAIISAKHENKKF